MENLPQEIIIDILSRLPVKTVGKCRCVSKPWNSLLSQPQFIKPHLKNTQHSKLPQQSLILASKDRRSLYSTHLNNAHQLFDEITLVSTKLTFTDHLFTSAQIYAMSCCNGLILVGDEEKNFSLINPATKEVNQLPPIPYAFDSRYCYPSFGVGYDPVTDDYKTVVICYYDTSKKHEPECIECIVNVYSVRNGTWKRAESSPYYHAVAYGVSGVCVEGCIHWAATRTDDLSFVISAFDLHNEMFREVPRPSSVDSETHTFNYVMMVGGCLGVRFYLDKGVVDFWKMEEYGVKESWTRFTVIEPEHEVMQPVCFMAKEQLVLVKHGVRRAICVICHTTLLLYSLKDGTFKNIGVDGIPENYSSVWTFIESLVSPHRGNGVA